jgi:hypothetical protein
MKQSEIRLEYAAKALLAGCIKKEVIIVVNK